MRSVQFKWIDSKAFFVELGKRIAQLRKEQGLTQQQLAEQIGIAQQTLAHYEVARLRVSASMLPQLAQIFSVPVNELIGLHAIGKSKRAPVPKLQQHLERISQLPKSQQRFVLQVLESVLAQAANR